jgi:hypothetical protein
MSEQATVNSESASITEMEFIKLCDDIYADRKQIYEFNPNMSHMEALLWMLTGCLISLLDITDNEQPGADDSSAKTDPYGAAIREIIRQRAQPPFDPQPYLSRLLKQIEEEQQSETR